VYSRNVTLSDDFCKKSNPSRSTECMRCLENSAGILLGFKMIHSAGERPEGNPPNRFDVMLGVVHNRGWFKSPHGKLRALFLYGLQCCKKFILDIIFPVRRLKGMRLEDILAVENF